MIELEKQYKNSLKNITFIDLFAGIGGFHLALESFGAKCVFSSEWDKFAQKVYQNNFGYKPKGDITKIKEENIPEHDILCGGFPCQAFSISGKRLGFEDTRGTLFFDIARIAKYHQPKILFLENVKNLAKHDNGKTLETITNILNNIGYNVYHKVLNASYFGAPQARERVFIIGLHKNLNIKNFRFPTNQCLPITLKDIILSDEKTKKYITNRNDIKINNSVRVDIDIFGNYPLKPIRVGIVNKGGQGERIYHECGHAITLSAYGGGAGAKTGLYLINNKIRKLAPRECARVSGFPDNFIIDKSDSQAYKQFGNSVVVNVLQFILCELVKQNIFDKEKWMKFTKIQKLGSDTAKGGFANEKDICVKFNNWEKDNEAKKWLEIMGYNLNKIEKLEAVQIPTRIRQSDLDKYNCSEHEYEELTKFKKADAQIKLLIKIGPIWKIENISIKKANKDADFNQIDKRSVDTYQKMWRFDDEISKWLKLFTGETLPSSCPNEIKKLSKKDKRRLFLTEMPEQIQNKIITFFEKNKILVVSDILKGRGGLSADWILVTLKNKKNNTTKWILEDINTAMNYYAQGDVTISPRGSLYIGRITVQRKGGTPDPTSLQFKFHPCQLFGIDK